MTFTALEQSVHDGQPLELYKFSVGALNFTMTSGDEAVTFQSQLYTPTQLQRDSVESSNEISKMQMGITVARDNDVARLFVASAPGVVRLEIFRMHRGDSETVTSWKGKVVSVTWSGITARILAEPIFTSLKRAGIRGNYQKLCRHALYDTNCTLNNTAFKDIVQVISLVGFTLTVNPMSRADGYYTGGYLVLNNTDMRTIRDHTGAVLTMMSIMPTLSNGDTIDLFAGCAHTKEICDTKFNNLPNFGGFPYLPVKNPFKGDSLF